MHASQSSLHDFRPASDKNILHANESCRSPVPAGSPQLARVHARAQTRLGPSCYGLPR